MSDFTILSHNNATKRDDISVRTIDSIPGDMPCVVCLGGAGITTSDKAGRLASIISHDILHNIADIHNYVLMYDNDLNPDLYVKTQFEQYNQNIINDAVADVPINLYITEQNLDHVFRHGAAHLIHENYPKLNFIVDGNMPELRERIRKKILSETNAPQKYVKNIFPVSLWFSKLNLDALFDAILLPRIIDKNGKPLSTDIVKQHIRKINFFAHCFGAYIALELEKRLGKKLREMGYSLHDIREIQSNMLVIAINPACALGTSKSQFVSFISAYDDTVLRPQNWATKYITEKRDMELHENQKWNLKPGFWSGQRGNIFFVKKRFDLSNVGNQSYISANEHNNIRQSADGLTPDGKLMMRFMYNVIANGVKNSIAQKTDKFVPLPPVNELILDGRNDKELTREFNKMQTQGQRTRQDVLSFATERVRKKIRSPRPNSKANTR